jgi:hypothetical protein
MAPELNVTVPVGSGAPAAGPLLVTVAVKATGIPAAAGSGDESVTVTEEPTLVSVPLREMD